MAVQAMVQQWCLLRAGFRCPSLQWWWCSKHPEVERQRKGLPSQRGHRFSSLPSLLYRSQALRVWTWEPNKILWNQYFGKLAIGSWNSFVRLRHCRGLGSSQTNQRQLTLIIGFMFVNRSCSCQDLCIKGVSDRAALHCHGGEFSSIWWPREQWQSCLAMANHSMQVLQRHDWWQLGDDAGEIDHERSPEPNECNELASFLRVLCWCREPYSWAVAYWRQRVSIWLKLHGRAQHPRQQWSSSCSKCCWCTSSQRSSVVGDPMLVFCRPMQSAIYERCFKQLVGGHEPFLCLNWKLPRRA